MAEIASLTAITKSFGGVRALRGAAFDVQAGEVHALVGENGAGKSTLMRVLGGEIAPSSGEISIDGKPSISAGRAKRARMASPSSIRSWRSRRPVGGGEHLSRRISGLISWSALRRRASN